MARNRVCGIELGANLKIACIYIYNLKTNAVGMIL